MLRTETALWSSASQGVVRTSVKFAIWLSSPGISLTCTTLDCDDGSRSRKLPRHWNYWNTALTRCGAWLPPVKLVSANMPNRAFYELSEQRFYRYMWRCRLRFPHLMHYVWCMMSALVSDPTFHCLLLLMSANVCDSHPPYPTNPYGRDSRKAIWY